MSAVAAFGATAPCAARVGARFGRGGEAGSTWRRARALPRAVARSAAADVEAMASVSDAETGAADDDDLRFVYLGNFDFFTLEETIEAAGTGHCFYICGPPAWMKEMQAEGPSSRHRAGHGGCPVALQKSKYNAFSISNRIYRPRGVRFSPSEWSLRGSIGPYGHPKISQNEQLGTTG